MKTNTKSKNQKSGLQSRPEQLSTETAGKAPNTDRPQIDFARRVANRQLDTESLLALLRNETPRFFELAEVVGQWVWLRFEGKQPSDVTRVLAELGFHWNNTRQVWQHPCGTMPDNRASYDPRRRYGSYFAADQKAA